MNRIRTYQTTYFYQSGRRSLDGVREIDNLWDLEVHNSDCLICICLWAYGGRDMGTASVPPVWQLLFKERSWNPHLHVPFTLWWTVSHKTVRIIASVQKCNPNLLRATQKINLEFHICMHFFLSSWSFIISICFTCNFLVSEAWWTEYWVVFTKFRANWLWTELRNFLRHHGKSNPHITP